MRHSPRIRPIALAIVRRGDDLLVYHDYDRVKDEAFCRPLGGGIEFGEPAEQAVRRELVEELGAELANVALLTVQESIFELNGRSHHQIAFMFTADLVDPSFYERDHLGRILDAEEEVTWQPLAELFDPTVSGRVPGKKALHPNGLLGLLLDGG